MIKDFDNIKKLIQRAKSENHYHYLDYDKMLFWQELLKKRQLRKSNLLELSSKKVMDKQPNRSPIIP